MKYLKNVIELIFISTVLLVPFNQVVAADGLSNMDCIIEPKSTIELGSSEEGILSEMLVVRGDRVKKGQLIARLDSKLERINAKLARYRANTDVSLRAARAEVEFRRKELNRLQLMFSKKAISEKDFDQAAIELRLAVLAVETAKTDLKIAKINSELASAQLGRRSIYSPLDGVVEEVIKREGEYVYEQAPLIKIAQLDVLNVEVFIPVDNYGAVTVGMAAEVKPEEPVGGVYPAEIIIIDHVFDPASRTFGVRLELPNLDYSLPAGLRCKVSFKTEAVEELPPLPLIDLKE